MAYLEGIAGTFRTFREHRRIAAANPGFDYSGRSLHYRGEWCPSSNIPSTLQECRSRFWVAPLKIGTIDDLQEGIYPVSQNTWNRENPLPTPGLKEFIQMPLGAEQIPVNFMDNHQHALYFWCQAMAMGRISPGSVLVHFDDHMDTRSPRRDLDSISNLGKVHDYILHHAYKDTFIVPAAKNRIIGMMLNIKADVPADYCSDWVARDSKDNIVLQGKTIGPDNPLLERIIKGEYAPRNLIVADWDTDYFLPLLTEEERERKMLLLARQASSLEEVRYRDLRKILAVIEASGVATVATSPDHINQRLSLDLIRRMFNQPYLH